MSDGVVVIRAIASYFCFPAGHFGIALPCLLGVIMTLALILKM